MDQTDFEKTEAKKALIWKWLKVWGIVIFVICSAAAIYSIVNPNKSPLQPHEKDYMDNPPAPPAMSAPATPTSGASAN